MYYNLLKTACIDSLDIHSLCRKLELPNCISSANTPSTFELIASLIFNAHIDEMMQQWLHS